MDTTPPVHLRLRGRLDEAGIRLALRSVLTASHLLGLATGTHLRKLRAHVDPLLHLQARVEEAELRARLATEAAEMLGARFAKLPERRRPYYSPAERFRILEIKNLLAWSAYQAARVFLVCPNTILNWEKGADPESGTVGSTIKPTPPIRRAADLVRATAQLMTRIGFGGQDLVARTLTRAGWKVSARSVGRYRSERTVTVDPTPPGTDKKKTTPVITRFVHHIWMMDLSHIKQFLGPDLYMATVFDAHSRVPLLLEVFQRRPSASQMASLLRQAGRLFSNPRYVITDLGGEFDARIFRKAVQQLGAVLRLASADSILATARLERFWKTLKESARLCGTFDLPLDTLDVESRLQLALLHYIAFRPHEGLGGATPLEVFLGTDPEHEKAVEPPRGRKGQGSTQMPFRAGYLDPKERRFPFLIPAA